MKEIIQYTISLLFQGWWLLWFVLEAISVNIFSVCALLIAGKILCDWGFHFYSERNRKVASLLLFKSFVLCITLAFLVGFNSEIVKKTRDETISFWVSMSLFSIYQGIYFYNVYRYVKENETLVIDPYERV